MTTDCADCGTPAPVPHGLPGDLTLDGLLCTVMACADLLGPDPSEVVTPMFVRGILLDCLERHSFGPYAR